MAEVRRLGDDAMRARACMCTSECLRWTPPPPAFGRDCVLKLRCAGCSRWPRSDLAPDATELDWDDVSMSKLPVRLKPEAAAKPSPSSC